MAGLVKTYHFGTDEFVSIADLVNKICNLTGVCFSDLVIMAEDRPGKDAAYLMDCTKAFNELGWRPEILLDDGLTSCYQWVKSNLNNIRDMKTVYVHKQ